MINPMSLQEKHIFVTGASSGIGRQCAIQASKLGAKVTLVARSADRLAKTVTLMDNKQLHHYYAFDLTQTDKIENLVVKIVEEQGAVDGFCNAAGISTLRPLKFINSQFLDSALRINLYAFIELVRSLSMKKNLNQGASIVGISSVAAEDGNPGQASYAIAKAGINGFIHPAARELAKRKIRINNVAFSMVDTEMFKEFMQNSGSEKLLNRQYLGVVDVESAANAVMFLLSDASKYITETILPVYAGY